MSRTTNLIRCALFALAAIVLSDAVYAHSASDAYLTLVEPAPADQPRNLTVLHAQWDIALRDLDFVLKLDDNGDGDIVWGELRKHQKAIAQYVFQYLRASGDGKSCRISPTGQKVDNHADGAYASLTFDVACSGAPVRLGLDYRLFFAIDPSHRAIVILHRDDNIATALLSSDKTQIDLGL
jgi:hypothetical protein